MKLLPAIFVLATLAGAHPMGNFSVNHYTRVTLRGTGADLTFILDIAEIPTFQLLTEWKVDAKDQAAVRAAVRTHAPEWLGNLAVSANGIPGTIRLKSVEAATTDGAGAMPVLRITLHGFVAAAPGVLTFEDRNYPGRAGWKEIVTGHDASAEIRSASPKSQDLSVGLTQYPTDPSITPPQDTTARVEWVAIPTAQASTAPVVTAPPSAPAAPEAPPATPAAPAQTFVQQQPSAPGTVERGDTLSRLLGRKDLSTSWILLGLLTAFGLGALHAMSPGHGKTIVAAYLVGSRGTVKHAGLLGLVVTVTHTFTVFLLGLGVLFFQHYVVPEKIVPVLGAISGLSIVFVGFSLLRTRIRALKRKRAQPHSHAIEGEITAKSLIALGISGGLVPCPSALILMLSAIALGRPALGLLLLLGFSTGLAIVLMGVGFAALFAKSLLPKSEAAANGAAFRWLPVLSAVVVIVVGVAMTAASTGWIQPLRFLS